MQHILWKILLPSPPKRQNHEHGDEIIIQSMNSLTKITLIFDMHKMVYENFSSPYLFLSPLL